MSEPSPGNGALPLEGLRVLEYGGLVAIPYAGKLLAALGAEVLKVEPPEGDISRRAGPFPGDTPDPERSGLFAYLNANKRGVVLDLDGEAGREGFAALAAGAGVLLEDVPVSRARALGLDPAALAAANPSLIHLSLTPFGHEGPSAWHRGYELNALAMSGVVLAIGEQERPPLPVPDFVGSFFAGAAGALAVALVAFDQERSGKRSGEWIDLAIADAWATFQTGLGLVTWLFGTRKTVRSGRRQQGGPYPYCILRCADGDFRLIAMTKREWNRFVEAMGAPEWTRDPRFQDRVKMNDLYAGELDTLIEAWLRQHTKQELFELFYERGVPFTPVKNFAEVLADPHLAARGFFVEAGDPHLPGVRFPGLPMHFRGLHLPPLRPAPRLTPATPAVPWEGRAAALSSAGPPARPILAGLRVVDMGWVWAGAIAGQILAEWGADVVKVESTTRLDPARQGRPIVGEAPDPEQNPMFHNANRRKRSLTVDIRRHEGQELVKALVAGADVVIENMTPHALADAGLAYPDLCAVNPRIIMLSHPLAGNSGPFRELRGYGPTAASISGLDAITGYEGGERITGFSHAVADPVVGVLGAFAIAAALRQRERTGAGRHIDLSMWEGLASFLPIGLIDAQLNGRSGSPRGNDHPLYAPHGIYRCRDADGTDQWIAIACATEEEWQALVAAMDGPAWAAEGRFADRAGRREHRIALDARIHGWTEAWDKLALEEYLQARGVAATACRDQGDRYLDPHLKARGAWVEVEHPVLGTEPLYGNPMRMRHRQPAPMRRAPLLGEHNAEVLREWLGLDAAAIARLADAGVLS